MTALLDLLPLIAFFIASKKFGLLAGAAAVLAATLAVYGIHLVRQKWRLTKQQWVVLVLTILFCGATILLRDDLYLRWKTPIINLSERAITYEQREIVIHALMHIPSEEITVDTAKVLTLLVLWAHKSELPVLIGDDLMAALNGKAVMH